MWRSHSSWRTVVILVSTVVLAACGGSSPSSSTGTSSPTHSATTTPTHTTTAVDPCTLVTAAELMTLTGTAPGTPVATTANLPGGATAPVCTWTASSWGLVITVEPGDKNAFDAAQQSASAAGTVVPIPNLGDGAFETQSPDVVTLAVLKGSRIVVILYTRFSPNPSQIGAQLAQLGTTVVGRLPA